MNATAQLGERVVTIGVPTPSLLSVLTPFHRHDPSEMLKRMASAPAGVEFVLLDDGSGSAELLANVLASAGGLGVPVRVIVWGENGGRGAARNRLIAAAAGAYVLFLDADMLPDSPDFLRNWLDVIERQAPDVAFGGLSLAHVAATPETALHHDLFGRSDCRPAAERALRPAQSVATANLLVRRSFLAAQPFDEGFVGWGFEDVDWALSAARKTDILHIDNPATHAGLDDVETLMRKSAQAGRNFARLAAKHPIQVRRFAGFKAAEALRQAPAQGALRSLFAALTRAQDAPMALRRVALKLYRASHYAEHLA